MEWKNIDPRDMYQNVKEQNIVILRPSEKGWKQKNAGLGLIDTHHSYSIFTSFEDHKIIGPDDLWDISWWWISFDK